MFSVGRWFETLDPSLSTFSCTHTCSKSTVMGLSLVHGSIYWTPLVMDFYHLKKIVTIQLTKKKKCITLLKSMFVYKKNLTLGIPF